MSALAICLLAGVVWFLLVLGLMLRRIPSAITRVYVKAFARRIGAEPWNRIGEPNLATAGPTGVVMASPDMVNLFGTFDATSEPVRIRCRVPDWDTYWSISLFAWNTDNFFVLNDLGAESRDLELMITAPGAAYQKQGNEKVIAAPTPRGVVLVRAVIKDRDDAEEIARVQQVLKQTTIAPYSRG